MKQLNHECEQAWNEHPSKISASHIKTQIHVFRRPSEELNTFTTCSSMFTVNDSNMNQKDVSNVSNTCLISSGFLREVDQHIYFLWYQIFVWKNAVCKIMTNQEISATAKMFHKIVYLQEEVLLQQSDHIISVCVSCCHGNQVIMRWQDHHRIRRTWITDTRVFTVSQQNNSRYRIKPWFTSTLSS